MKKLISFLLILSFMSLLVLGCKQEIVVDYTLNAKTVKNVILFIGDGMGPEQIKLGSIVKEKSLIFEDFKCKTMVDTRCVDSNGQLVTTDSAAASTALSTGTLTTAGRVGMEPGSTDELKTIVDWAKELGKRTGVMTTEEITGATPMGFSAHSESRSSKLTLCESAATSGVDLFASDSFLEDTYFTDEGYTMVNYLADYNANKNASKLLLNVNVGPTRIVDKYGIVYVESFANVVTTALDYLSQDEDGFFLMAEGAHIDHGGHNNNVDYMLEELLAFDEGVEAALKWAQGRTDTVVLVTADHETGDLHVADGTTKDNYKKYYTLDKINYSLRAAWGSTSHSDAHVGLYINGKDVDFSKYNADKDSGVIKNIQIFNIVKDLLYNNI